MHLHSRFVLESVMLFLLFIHHVAATSVTPSPLPLAFPALTPDFPGTLRTAIPDIHQNIYTTGISPSHAFIVKYTPSNRISWTLSYPSRILPSLAYDPRFGLYALFANDENQGVADIVLVKLKEDSGLVSRQALVERVKIPNETAMKLVLASAEERDQAFVYIVYIVQDGVNPSEARTKVVRMQDGETGFRRVWDQVVTPSGFNARSAIAAEEKRGGSVLIAEIVRNSIADMLAVHVLNAEGLNKSASTEVKKNAILSAFAVDDDGAMFVGMRPSNLDKLVFLDMPGETLVTAVWSAETDVVDIVGLRNGSSIYVLSEEQGFRIENDQTVRAVIPVLSMVNSSGDATLMSKYEEKVPDTERRYFSLSLLEGGKSGKAVLAGFLKAAGEEAKAAIAYAEFPSLGEKQDDLLVFVPPNDHDESAGGQNRFVIGVGVAAGIAALAAVVGGALYFVHKREATVVEVETAVADVEATEQERRRPLEKEYHVLV